MRNTDDTQSIASDDDDADFLDDHNFLDESDEVDADVDEDSKERNRKFFLKKKVNEDQNLDKARKNGVVWTKLKNGEDLSLRKKINSSEKPGPTSYAARNMDNTNEPMETQIVKKKRGRPPKILNGEDEVKSKKARVEEQVLETKRGPGRPRKARHALVME
ncbi:hypothetical protein BpHYR1_053003 [Brachionus plicatilis]|uniref:Uncharacterized protein n=1 Tax=Brachionus plicatilis TaxID=10195 RepID=A0A3M7SAE0_BRAPC|nr:hypothetical protein BpHYR1_053003 [Brachionus plicatilis]